MRRSLSPRLFASSLTICLSAATVCAWAETQAQKTPVTSPTKVLKAVQYTGPMILQTSGNQNSDGSNHSLSPYLYVAGGDPARDQVPLKKTWAEVNIAGVIAAVKVHQVFENTGAKPIEAIYVFPASTRAAVHAMRMKIGARTIDAKIERKAEARALYEAAKQSGKRASLLEQERPNVFTTSVANIMPGDRIEVELDYSELVVPENATYEFVYPTVVGPRYAGGADAKADQWMANPHLPEGKQEPYAWDVKVHLQTGIGLKEVSSPSHKIAVNYAGPSTADIKVDQNGGGNKDFVLRYRLAGDKIETGLLQFEEPSAGLGRPAEKFFALLVEPPKRPTLADIPGREFIFLLDVSGSMHGFPIDTSKELMRNLLPKLRPTDHFNLVFFSGANYVWSPSGSRPATPANINEGIGAILKQFGSGGTELMGGLEAAYAIPPVGKGVSRTVVVVTDGYVGIEAKAFRFIRERLDQANLFAFGIGSSVNRALIEGMARAGLGEPFIVLGPQKAAEQAEKLRQMIDRPLLTDIEVRFGDSGAYEVAPEKIPDLLAERPLLIYGKYRGDKPTRIEISGRTGHGAFHHAIDLRPADARKENSALRALWARKWVAVLEDEFHMGGGKPVEDAITDLGLFYNLLTPFTSFVAIDSEVVNRDGKSETVRQPLPMPEGVSNYAVAEGQMRMASAPQGSVNRITSKQIRHTSGGQLDDLSGFGGGLRPSAPEPMAAAAPPPTRSLALPGIVEKPQAKGKSAGAPKESEVAKDEADRKSGERDKEVTCKIEVKVDKAKQAGDTKALQTLVERTARANGCQVTGSIKLRITLDSAGKIASVVVESGDNGVGQALVRKLTGVTSTTRATSQGKATVELTITISLK
jgi:Ca-activated chloride channel family protein